MSAIDNLTSAVNANNQLLATLSSQFDQMAAPLDDAAKAMGMAATAISDLVSEIASSGDSPQIQALADRLSSAGSGIDDARSNAAIAIAAVQSALAGLNSAMSAIPSSAPAPVDSGGSTVVPNGGTVTS